jgi:hypothetical protein
VKEKLASGAGMLFAGAITLIAVSMVLSAIANAIEAAINFVGVLLLGILALAAVAYAVVEARHPGRVNAYLDSKTNSKIPNPEQTQRIDDFFGIVGSNPHIRRQMNGNKPGQPHPPRRRKPNGKNKTGGVSSS